MNKRGVSSRFWVAAVITLCLGGGWISGQLVQQQAALWSGSDSGGGVFDRVCRATATVGLDCTAAHNSRWAALSVPLPLPASDFTVHVRRVTVPVAFLGLAYFVFITTWFVFVGRPHADGGRWQRAPLLVGWMGAAFSALYLVLMLTRLAPACAWCIAAHAVNLSVLPLMRRMYRVERSGQPQPCVPRTDVVRMVPASRQAVHAVVFALIVVAGLWVYRHEQIALGKRIHALLPYKHAVAALRADADFLLREYDAQPIRVVPTRSNDPATSALPQLVVFTNFECSQCYCNADRLRKMVRPAFYGDLAITVRHLPHCPACDSAEEGHAHSEACRAARAAEAARLQGGDAAFERMHDALFENQKRLGSGLYARLAFALGLDADRLVRDMESDAVRGAVAADVALARALSVDATPTMFLDGRRVGLFGRDNSVFWHAVADRGRWGSVCMGE